MSVPGDPWCKLNPLEKVARYFLVAPLPPCTLADAVAQTAPPPSVSPPSPFVSIRSFRTKRSKLEMLTGLNELKWEEEKRETRDRNSSWNKSKTSSSLSVRKKRKKKSHSIAYRDNSRVFDEKLFICLVRSHSVKCEISFLTIGKFHWSLNCKFS